MMLLEPSARDDAIARNIVDAAIAVHRALGPGLLESAYETRLAYELTKRGHIVALQVPRRLRYGSVDLDIGYRLDLLVDERVIVELKVARSLTDVDLAQLLTYLKLSDLHVGLLINFNSVPVKDGIRRVVRSS